jgi:nucleotide-binding universal stress UspA family protein
MKVLAPVCRPHFIDTPIERRRAVEAPQPGLVRVAARGTSFLMDSRALLVQDKCIRTSSRPLLLLNSVPEKHYRKILVATDFSDTSRQAATFAVRAFPDAQFAFLHVFLTFDERELHAATHSFAWIESRRRRARENAIVELDHFVDALGADRQLISRVVRPGAPMRAICNYARTMCADLIVIGNPAQSRLKRLLYGSTARQLMDGADCDLLIAPAKKR